jgi:hypothetical protein
MKIPNAERAVIAEEKLCKYLLNAEHRRGGSKARLLLRMGYTMEGWQQLEEDLRASHLTRDVERVTDTEYGPRYELVAPLTGPAGLSILFRSVWQIDSGTDVPRRITIYPE